MLSLLALYCAGLSYIRRAKEGKGGPKRTENRKARRNYDRSVNRRNQTAVMRHDSSLEKFRFVEINFIALFLKAYRVFATTIKLKEKIPSIEPRTLKKEKYERGILLNHRGY